MPPLKSAELHRLAREELGPPLTTLGFARTRSTTAGWARQAGDGWLVLWMQPSRSTGSSAQGEFTIELRLSRKPELGGDGPRKRLPALLDEADLDALRRQHGIVVHGRDDMWFRQTDEASARALLAFLGQALPRAIDRFLP